jgi:hypothetical protein
MVTTDTDSVLCKACEKMEIGYTCGTCGRTYTDDPEAEAKWLKQKRAYKTRWSPRRLVKQNSKTQDKLAEAGVDYLTNVDRHMGGLSVGGKSRFYDPRYLLGKAIQAAMDPDKAQKEEVRRIDPATLPTPKKIEAADRGAMKPPKSVPKAKYRGGRLPATKLMIDENLIMRTQRYYALTARDVLEVNPGFIRWMLDTPVDDRLPETIREKLRDLMAEMGVPLVAPERK